MIQTQKNLRNLRRNMCGSATFALSKDIGCSLIHPDIPICTGRQIHVQGLHIRSNFSDCFDWTVGLSILKSPVRKQFSHATSYAARHLH